MTVDRLLSTPGNPVFLRYRFTPCESARTWSLMLGFTRRGDLGSAMRKVGRPGAEK
jgi:hypothetical protein